MRFFSEEESAEAVNDRIGPDVDPRTRQLAEAAVRHLHAFIKEVEPSLGEWFSGIQFLTSIGQISNDWRQEFVLLSDTLGVSMLVETINNRAGSVATEATVLGPFHVDGAPTEEMGADLRRDGKGEPSFVSGRVTNEDGEPIEGAVLDVWSTNDEGFYDVQQDEQPEMNLRGKFVTGADGTYSFVTTKPVSYPIPDDGPVGRMLRTLGRHPYRPGHIHFILEAPGYQRVVTHIFAQGDEYLTSDTVFGVKESLVVDFAPREDGGTEATFDFVLKREE